MAGNVVTSASASASASAGALIGRRVHWGSSEEDLRNEDGSNSIDGDPEVAGGGGKGEDHRQKRRVYSSNSATCLDRNNNNINNINNNRRNRKTSIEKGSEQRGAVMRGAETQGTDPRGPRTTLPRVSEPGESEPGERVQSEVNAEHNVNRDDEPQEAERKDQSNLNTRTRNECVPIRIVNTIIMFLCFSAFIVGMMVTLYREAMRIDDKNHRITTTTTTTPRPHAA